MKINETKFRGIVVIDKKKFKDKRGYFLELFKKNLFKNQFPFTSISLSKKSVLRGLHLQLKKKQGKYVSVLKGEILDVAVDLRKNSKTFGKHFKIILSEKNSKSIFIPPGFAHGFYALGKENYILYSCTNYRHKKSEIGIKWNGKVLGIKWPKKNPIISQKDKKNISLKEFIKKY